MKTLFHLALTLCLLFASTHTLRAQPEGLEVGGSINFATTSENKLDGSGDGTTSISFCPYAQIDITDVWVAGLGLCYKHTSGSIRTTNKFGITPFVGYRQPLFGRLAWFPTLALTPMAGRSSGRSVVSFDVVLQAGKFRYTITPQWAVDFSFAAVGYSYFHLKGTGSTHDFMFNVNPLNQSSVSVAYRF